MQLLITSQQIRKFIQFGWIELEQFLSEKEADDLLHQAKAILHKRCKNSNIEELYKHGQDLWRESSFLKDFYCSQRFGHTASTLCNKPYIFLACDQWIPEGKTFTPLRLEAHTSFRNLVCGCLLSLEGETKGNARFLQTNRLMPFDKSQLLITFGTPQTVYVHNERDPNNNALKAFGYSYGDSLKATLNPSCKT